MASIAGMLPSDVNVLRDGRQLTMPARDIVVGDLVYVSLGDKVSTALLGKWARLIKSYLPICDSLRFRPI
jgi:hypothetical protein